MLGAEGVGIALDDVGDLAAALAAADVAALRARVAERRARYTVEAQIGQIAALYRGCRRRLGRRAAADGNSGRLGSGS